MIEWLIQLLRDPLSPFQKKELDWGEKENMKALLTLTSKQRLQKVLCKGLKKLYVIKCTGAQSSAILDLGGRPL